MNEGREVPSNVEAEQALLGAVLVNNDAYHVVSGFLRPDHFFEPLHRAIYQVCGDLIRNNQVATPVTIKTFLPENQKLGDITVAQYLARLAAEAVTVINAADYGRAVRDVATRRRLISIGEDMAAAAYDMPSNESPRTIADKFQGDIMEAVATNADTMGAVSFGEAVEAAINSANAAHMNEGRQSGAVWYGVEPLERLIGPLHGGQLILFGGATKQGKTALVGQVAMGAALKGTNVDFYSGEMTPKELAMREISRRVGVPVRKQKRGDVTEAQFEQMIALQQTMKDVRILIQDRRMTLPQLKDRWRRIVHKRGRSLLICDHIGLLERDKATARMDTWQFGEEVTKELKVLARELDCPIIACVQLKKNTFADNKTPVSEKFLDSIIRRRPRYADLTGGVEKDADHVVIPFRPEVFLKEHEPSQGTELYGVWEAKVNAWRGKAQLVLALSRERDWPAHVDVGWSGVSTTFFEIGSENPDRFEAVQEFRADPMRLL